MELANHQDDYSPKVASIGPNFHGRPELSPLQKFKPTALNLLIAGGTESIHSYHAGILQIKDEIREFYDERSIEKFSDDELAEMMLLDAALIVTYMEISAQPPLDYDKVSRVKEHLGMWTVAILPRDLFLLRNQIPFSAVEVLIGIRYGLGKDTQFLDRFLTTILHRENRRRDKEASLPAPVPQHLLEALHRKIVSGSIPKANQGSIETRKPIHSFRTATDLKAKGVTFNPSPTESLKDVSVTCYFFYARIHLPVWAVSTHTKVLLKNLVAYELCPSSPAEMEVTSYINLMKSLIDGAEDVKELRERRVLCNMLSCDEEAAAVFTGIDTHGVDNPRLYGDVKEQIDAHCDLRVNTWMAELLHSYLRSPWTITAFVAATVLLGISAAQLYFAAYPPPN